MLDWDGIRYFLEVARTQRVSAAALRLGVQHTTVSRRIQALEHELATILFNKSKSTGFTLTEEGMRFFAYAEQIESTLLSAREDVSGQSQTLSGHLRVGSTEGFGNYVLAPLMTDFQRRFPAITLDIMPVPRFISLSKREADIAISLERPQRGPYLCTKLIDYSLKLYGTAGYLAGHPPIRAKADLADHTFIGYVEELLFSDRLRYLEDIVLTDRVIFKSTSVIAQYHAALQGRSLAILPCFMAAQDLRLQPVLEDEIALTRSFWMYCHEDLRQSRRVMALWDFLKKSVQLNAPLLRGEASRLLYLE
ncbi:LysR family transcriptional regulator [Pollutimonas bauzanensis]|uniref:DNA-binding transcriptional regulator, LysR family n=1 Tax=Pollutimonas bauzanensis TaxID=658167 RepID=A0A1M5ZVA6_9BURK|nr:LysR family transcriptional regulator [Pollutimonas bauzanensis]SHI28191.1 DNA-binding transcriptional regulator, LysR family [Pollutimonas bauzanensis]